jgi:hypothetical protein
MISVRVGVKAANAVEDGAKLRVLTGEWLWQIYTCDNVDRENSGQAVEEAEYPSTWRQDHQHAVHRARKA